MSGELEHIDEYIWDPRDAITRTPWVGAVERSMVPLAYEELLSMRSSVGVAGLQTSGGRRSRCTAGARGAAD